MSTFKIETRANLDAVDITDQIAGTIEDDGATLAFVSSPHTTVGLVLGPADPAMLRDFIQLSKRWPAGHGPFEHFEEDNPNSEAHLQSAVFGTRLLIGLDSGRLQLGTYQRIVFVEFDGPRRRTVSVDTMKGA